MFYSKFMFVKRGPLSKVWIAAHFQRKLNKTMVQGTDIDLSAKSILDPATPLALRLSGQLLLGLVRIYQRKVKYLQEDCSVALSKMKMTFRPGVVDLPVDAATAPTNQITHPDNWKNTMDCEIPDVPMDQLERLMMAEEIGEVTEAFTQKSDSFTAKSVDITLADDREMDLDINLAAGDLLAAANDLDLIGEGADFDIFGDEPPISASKSPKAVDVSEVEIGRDGGAVVPEEFNFDLGDHGPDISLGGVTDESSMMVGGLDRSGVSIEGLDDSTIIGKDIPVTPGGKATLSAATPARTPATPGGAAAVSEAESQQIGSEQDAPAEPEPESEAVVAGQARAKAALAKAASRKRNRRPRRVEQRDAKTELSSKVIQKQLQDTSDIVAPRTFLPLTKKAKRKHDRATVNLGWLLKQPSSLGFGGEAGELESDLSPVLLNLFQRTVTSEQLDLPISKTHLREQQKREQEEREAKEGMMSARKERAEESAALGEEPEVELGLLSPLDQSSVMMGELDFSMASANLDESSMIAPTPIKLAEEVEEQAEKEKEEEAEAENKEKSNWDEAQREADLFQFFGKEPSDSPVKKAKKGKKAQGGEEDYADWSWRTKKMHQLLKNEMKNKKSLGFEKLVEERSRNTAAGVFYQLLVLKTHNFIGLEQADPFGAINITKDHFNNSMPV